MQLASAEKVTRDWVASTFPSARVVTETPANLADVLPCIQVERIGGSDTVFETIDDAIIDVEYFAASRDAARVGAEAVRAAFRFDLPGQTIGSAFVLSVATVTAPVWTPYPNTSVRRFHATYQLRLHTH